MCFEAGLPRGRAVRLAVDASGSSEIRAHVARRSERELNVLPLAKLFEGSRILPGEMLAQMSVADATGLYAETLRRYADALEKAW
jgi:type II secretory pathway component PulF